MWLSWRLFLASAEARWGSRTEQKDYGRVIRPRAGRVGPRVGGECGGPLGQSACASVKKASNCLLLYPIQTRSSFDNHSSRWIGKPQ